MRRLVAPLAMASATFVDDPLCPMVPSKPPSAEANPRAVDPLLAATRSTSVCCPAFIRWQTARSPTPFNMDAVAAMRNGTSKGQANDNPEAARSGTANHSAAAMAGTTWGDMQPR